MGKKKTKKKSIVHERPPHSKLFQNSASFYAKFPFSFFFIKPKKGKIQKQISLVNGMMVLPACPTYICMNKAETFTQTEKSLILL